MRAITKPSILALGLAVAGATVVGATVATAALGAGTAFAQSAPVAAEPADAGVTQVALTPALVDQFIAAKKDIDSVLEKLPEGTDQPDPATMAKLDTVARKYKFADYKDYDTTENNVGIVMSGIDPETKRYIGPEAVIKKQIAEIEADKQISAKDKKDTIEQLNASMTTVPRLQFPGNVDVVTSNYDRLNEAMPQD